MFARATSDGSVPVAAGPLAAIEQELEQRWRDGDRIDEICRYALLPAGKLLRPRLLLAACEAVGGETYKVMPAAIGSECGHSASLIHDDIIDADELRRGRPSVHVRFGIDDAIVAGDMLIFHLFLCLSEVHDREVPAERVVAALRATSIAGLDVCRGQSREAEICGDPTCGVDEYIDVARLKTAALFRGTCESGAILGGGTPEQIAGLASYGDRLGVAFQIVDDLLGYTSSTDVMGKAASSDARNRRVTLPVILALRDGGATVRGAILRAFADGIPEAEAQALLAEALERAQALVAARRWAERSARDAREHLTVLPASPTRDLLAHVADLAIDRAA